MSYILNNVFLYSRSSMYQGFIFSNIFIFYKHLYIYKEQGLLEIRDYIRKAKKAFPMLFFAFSRNYGYAKARMLTFRGI